MAAIRCRPGILLFYLDYPAGGCRGGACDIFQLFLLRLYRLIILLFF